MSSQRIGPLSSSDLLAQGFKRPSKFAIAQGKARLLMEDMVIRAERKLLELKVKLDGKDFAEERMLRNSKPGSLLKKSEVARIYSESGCRAARPIPHCNQKTVNVYRTIDGTCNNLRNPLWGAAHAPFRRLLSPNYEDEISDMIGRRQSKSKHVSQGGILIHSGPFDPPFPSPRYVSQQIVANDSANELPLTHMVMQWGQFLDHDINLSPEPSKVKCSGCQETVKCQPIRVHPNDPIFKQCIPFKRTVAACTKTASGSFSGRQQINDITSYIDGSQIYGSSDKVAKKLRTFSNGLLKTGNGNNLPFTTDDCLMGLVKCYLAGDVRANEQVGLTAMHTLWVREHNRIAQQLKSLNSGWRDEKLYQETKKIVGAMLQKITYEDFIPRLMGRWVRNIILPSYRGYNETLDATIPNSFATGAFRFGHSLIRPHFSRFLSDKYERGRNKPLDLLKSFFNNKAFQETNLAAIFRGLVTDSSQRMDESLNSVLTTQLFKKTSAPGLDLAALNIQRQRDHGLPSYTVWRNYCHRLFPKLGMAEMRSDVLHKHLLKTYGYLENVDFWLGGISEKQLSHSIIGQTFACIFGLTFRNIRDGDRFWYENPGVFTLQQVREINSASLSRVICDNTDIGHIQKDVFLKKSWTNRVVPCSRFPKMNLKSWNDLKQENTCYIKIGHNKGKGVSFATINSKFGLQHFFHNEGPLNYHGCLGMSCPSKYFPESRGVRPTTRLGRKYCTMTHVNPQLPKNAVTDPVQKKYYYHAWGFTPSLMNGYSGMYKSMEQCKTGSYYAIKYQCSNKAEEHIHTEEDLYIMPESKGEHGRGEQQEVNEDEEEDYFNNREMEEEEEGQKEEIEEESIENFLPTQDELIIE